MFFFYKNCAVMNSGYISKQCWITALQKLGAELYIFKESVGCHSHFIKSTSFCAY